MDKGWIKLHRRIQEHSFFLEKRSFSKFEAWIDLLLMVNHKDNKFLLGNEMIQLKPGQKVTSIRQLSERWGWSVNKVKRFLELLQNERMITFKSDTKKTVVTIEKYEDYQHSDYRNGTPTEHQRNTNEKRTETNKNVKNDKNENNIKDEEETISSLELVTNFYQNNIGQINSSVLSAIKFMLEKHSSELVIEAYKKTITAGAKFKESYVNTLLDEWTNANVTNLVDLQNYQKQKGEKQPYARSGKKTNRDKSIPDQYKLW